MPVQLVMPHTVTRATKPRPPCAYHTATLRPQSDCTSCSQTTIRLHQLLSDHNQTAQVALRPQSDCTSCSQTTTRLHQLLSDHNQCCTWAWCPVAFSTKSKRIRCNSQIMHSNYCWLHSLGFTFLLLRWLLVALASSHSLTHSLWLTLAAFFHTFVQLLLFALILLLSALNSLFSALLFLLSALLLLLSALMLLLSALISLLCLCKLLCGTVPNMQSKQSGARSLYLDNCEACAIPTKLVVRGGMACIPCTTHAQLASGFLAQLISRRWLSAGLFSLLGVELHLLASIPSHLRRPSSLSRCD